MDLTKLEAFRKRIAHRIAMKPHYIRLKRGVLTICFDDFARTAWTNGGAVLGDQGVRGTYFVSGGLCNKTLQGMEFYTERDLQDAWSSKNEIGCHTFDHVSALKVSAASYQKSILRNNKFLLDVLGGGSIQSFAYPYNHTSLLAKLFTRRQFRLARGVGRCTNRRWADFSELSAINLSLSSVSGLNTGRKPRYDMSYLIERAAVRKEWLIVYTHDISDEPSEHGCRTSGLEDMIIRAKRAGLDIRPMNEVPALLYS